MPRSRSIAIQSERVERRSRLALTWPARLMAPPNSSNFSVSVVLPASGCEMIAKVRRRSTSAASGVFGIESEASSALFTRRMWQGKPAESRGPTRTTDRPTEPGAAIGLILSNARQAGLLQDLPHRTGQGRCHVGHPFDRSSDRLLRRQRLGLCPRT